MKQVTVFFDGKFVRDTNGAVFGSECPVGSYVRIQRMSHVSWYFIQKGNTMTPINECDVPAECKAWCLLLQ